MQHRVGVGASEFRYDTRVVGTHHDELSQTDVVREVGQHAVADLQRAHGNF
jgi:hypothetical protein